MEREVDIAALVKTMGSVDVSVSPQETPADAEHRRWKDKTLFVVGIAGLCILFVSCLGVLAFGSQQADEKKIWAGALTSLVSGMIGFTIGRK
jgi:hypothetical protein